MSGRTRIGVAIGAVAALAIGVIAFVMLDGAETDDARRTVEASGVTATVPDGWHVQKLELPKPTNNFTDDLHLYTDRSFMDENCGSESSYTTVLLSVGPPTGTTLEAIPRPEHFNKSQGETYHGQSSADVPCEASAQIVVFIDGGKKWKASLLFGRDAPEQKRAEAYRILDSLSLQS